MFSEGRGKCPLLPLNEAMCIYHVYACLSIQAHHVHSCIHTIASYTCTYSEPCYSTAMGTQNQYLSEVLLSGLVYVHEVYTGTE